MLSDSESDTSRCIYRRPLCTEARQLELQQQMQSQVSSQSAITDETIRCDRCRRTEPPRINSTQRVGNQRITAAQMESDDIWDLEELLIRNVCVQFFASNHELGGNFDKLSEFFMSGRPEDSTSPEWLTLLRQACCTALLIFYSELPQVFVEESELPDQVNGVLMRVILQDPTELDESRTAQLLAFLRSIDLSHELE